MTDEFKQDEEVTPIIFRIPRSKRLDWHKREQGQTISNVIFVEILRWSLSSLEAQIEEQKFNERPHS